MTTLQYFLADTYAAQTYEVVAALLIIIFSTVVIYFLARNVLKELRSHNHDKKMMRQKESEDLFSIYFKDIGSYEDFAVQHKSA